MSHETEGIGTKHNGANGFRTRNGIAKQIPPQNQSETKKGHGRQPTRRIPDKIFVERDSLLTQMFQVSEFRGLYNIFLVIFLNSLVYVTLSDYARHGEITLGWDNLVSSFGKPLLTIGVVGGLHLGVILSHGPFALWRQYRRKVIGADVIYGLYMSTFIILHIYIPIVIHSNVHFPLASAAIIVTEQVRLLMKLYAFYRVNISRSLKGESGGNLFQHLYFLYAPTLIYQDSYPRTKEIRWDFIIRNVVELLGCIWFYNVIHSLCGHVLLERFGLEPITLPRLIDGIFFQMIPGGVGFLLGFFVLLHTSQNVFAELLRFGDREFYKDWWNSETFSDFYRNWNLPVHGFLYTYIYKEAVEYGFRSKFVPAICVFFVSAVVHEYILAFVLGFFFPVLLLFFGGFGAALSFCNRPRVGGNPFIWWSLITGKGLLLFFYSLEHYSRVNNCQPAQTPFWDFVTPRSVSCLGNSLTLS